MNYPKVNSCILAVFLLLLTSCNPNPKKGALDENKMMDIMYDIYLAQAISSSSDTEPKIPRDILMESVMQKHKVTKAEFDHSLNWYADNIKKYMEVSDSVTARLQRSSQAVNNLRDLQQTLLREGENKDGKLLRLCNLNVFNSNFRFTLDSARLRNDSLLNFKWTFGIGGLSDGQSLQSGLYFTYKDTVVRAAQKISENGVYSFENPNLPDSLLKSISGYIHLKKVDTTSDTHIHIYDICYTDSIAS